MTTEADFANLWAFLGTLIFLAVFFAMGFWLGRRSIKDHEHD